MPDRDFAPLDFASAPLAGNVLVEASAGTGKTWTIAALVLRLLLEWRPGGRPCRIEDILVVTYTKAATAELRERIRALLVAARDGLATGRSDDPRIAHALAASAGRRQAALHDLELAIESFDLAPVHTIHGFCQRALSEHAFESARPFAAEILADETTLRERAAQDFWRRELAVVSAGRAAVMLARFGGPSGVLARIGAALDRPYAEIVPDGPPPDLDAAHGRVADAFADARAIWETGRAAITAAVAGAKLHAGSYPPHALTDWWQTFDEYFRGDADGEAPPKLAKLTPEALARGKTKTGTLPEHPFFGRVGALVGANEALAAAHAAADADLVQRALRFCREEVARDKERLGVQSYDDLLLGLRRALEGAGGADLAGALRLRYQAALIDEFQDTDPTQAEILQRIWGGTAQPLYFVGDPKQAIYGFRGADVFAYLAARERVGACYTLVVNQRSDPPLLDAVAALFAGRARFVIPEIGFPPVRPTSRARPRLNVDDGAAPFTVWRVPRDEDATKDAVRERIARAVAEDIARLLERSRAERALIELPGERPRPLAGGDIAVLVGTHREGDIVRKALAAAGLTSVTYGADSVFASHEAIELERVLVAAADLGSEPRLRAALATDFFGLDAEALARLAADGAEWEGWVERFRAYHTLAREDGFARMWRELAVREGIAARLLAHPDGERRMTNVTHLVELLHRRVEEEGLDLAELARALAHARDGPMRDPDAEQLRLESDEHLVNIVTVHRAKGLEFPVVYCPFLWDGRQRASRDATPVFHPPGAGQRAVVDLGGPDVKRHQRLAAVEELAGDLRLAYVALTRARHRCTVVWGVLPDAGTSALAWLLHGAERPAGDAHGGAEADPLTLLEHAWKSIDDEAIAERLSRLAQDARGAIAVTALPAPGEMPATRGPAAPEPLVARSFPGTVSPAWHMSSFTALVARTESESPDHDPLRIPEGASRRAARRDAFGIPGGVRFGTALHRVLEQLDFAGAGEARVTGIVGRELAAAGLDPAWVPAVVRLVADVLETPLEDGGFALRQLERARRLDELEFTYPVRAAAGVELARVLGPLRALGSRVPEAIGSLILAPARGFMRGFIDLVFEREGIYFIADYKSNWLGDTLADYAPARLGAAMAASFYDLQYLVYTVALHRMLAGRLRDYDYDRHFGGVYYLFARGMHPAQGPAAGVYFARPERALVEALDACLAPEHGLILREAVA
ncbi:MAG: exodeoxyribonuclease V subunit beta [Burkholderiales bacterium]|nr:exodeoxyribonuclease V subunit beta [Burkholderiales bacterium]